MDHTNELLLTIDVGTTNCKCALIGRDGTILGWSRAPYPEHYPQPGWVEQSPEDWWAAAGRSAAAALAAASVAPSRIAAIGVTGQMHGVVAVDAEGAALTPCLTLRDGRATAEAQEIVDRLGLDEIYRITGARLAPSLPAAKVCWIHKHHPEIYRQVRAFLAPKDLLRLRMTGQLATEVIDAAGMLLFDVRTGEWSEPMTRAAKVTVDRLPPVHAPWDPAGPLLAEAARHLGLVAGTPVIIGAGDDIEFLGYGVTEPGASLEHVGTTGSIMACVDAPIVDPELAIELYPHVQAGRWLAGGSVNAAGGAIDWARRALGGTADCDLDSLLAGPVQPGPALDRPLIFLPYLAGERCPIWDPAAKGGWFGLTLAHDREDLMRSVLEGVAFSLRHVLDRLESLAVPIPTLVIQKTEGDALWRAMRANIYGRPLRVVHTADPTALGTAIVAGVGIGLYASLADGVVATRGPEERMVPDPEVAASYDRLYTLYLELSTACHPLFPSFGGRPFPARGQLLADSTKLGVQQ